MKMSKVQILFGVELLIAYCLRKVSAETFKAGPDRYAYELINFETK